MTNLFMGYNVRETGVDYPALRAHTLTAKSSAMLHVDLLEAWRQKQATPNALVMWRCYGEEKSIPHDITPEKWLGIQLSRLAEKGIPPDQIILCPTNEAAPTPELAAWCVSLASLALAHPSKPKIAFLHFGVGQPEPEQWITFRTLLALCVAHPDQFYIALHEYCAVIWTSGVNDKRPGEYPIASNTWPTAVTANCWHMGRWRFLAKYCDEQFQKMPSILISEWGFDDIRDAESWQQAQPKTTDKISGWRTCEAAWHSYWPGWGFEVALYEQVVSAIPVLYEADYVAPSGRRYSTPICGICWFSEGNFGGDAPPYQRWQAYNSAGALTFKQMLEQHAQGTPLPPPAEPPPVVEPPPPTTGIDVSTLVKVLDQMITARIVQQAAIKQEIDSLVTARDWLKKM